MLAEPVSESPQPKAGVKESQPLLGPEKNHLAPCKKRLARKCGNVSTRDPRQAPTMESVEQAIAEPVAVEAPVEAAAELVAAPAAVAAQSAPYSAHALAAAAMAAAPWLPLPQATASVAAVPPGTVELDQAAAAEGVVAVVDAEVAMAGGANERVVVSKAPWTAPEDQLLVETVNKFGAGRWSTIAANIAGRSGKQCRERYYMHLVPGVKKDAWTEEEDAIIAASVAELGTKWVQIASRLPGRTDLGVKNRYHSEKRKREALQRKLNAAAAQQQQLAGDPADAKKGGGGKRRKGAGSSSDAAGEGGAAAPPEAAASVAVVDAQLLPDAVEPIEAQAVDSFVLPQAQPVDPPMAAAAATDAAEAVAVAEEAVAAPVVEEAVAEPVAEPVAAVAEEPMAVAVPEPVPEPMPEAAAVAMPEEGA